MKKIYAFITVALILLSSGCILGGDDETPDRDGDGVQDKYDACPDIAGDPSNQGCPVTTPAPASTDPPATTAAPTETDPPTTAPATTAAPTTTQPPETTSAPTVTETMPPETPVDTPAETNTITPPFTWFTPTFVPIPTNVFTTTPAPWTTLTMTFTIPPSFYLSPWLGEWMSTDGDLFSIAQLWLTYDETYGLQMHYFTRWLGSALTYQGHMTPEFVDGTLVGELEYDGSTQTVVLDLDSGTMNADITYSGTQPLTISSVLEKTDFVLPPVNDGFFIESYSGTYFDFGDDSYINNVKFYQEDPNTLRMEVNGRCVIGDCNWTSSYANFTPGVVVFLYEGLSMPDRVVRVTMSNASFINVETTVSGITYTQTLTKLIPL